MGLYLTSSEEFRLDYNQVIKGWTEGIPYFKEGDGFFGSCSLGLWK
jgi:hypothetical protein